ncbi:MAG: hypothetical protein QNK37_33365 [Acidobacteriota bacterium]|nr:hypothetical protein [Acidobacteriota bacterium]
MPWVSNHPEAGDWLRVFATRAGSPFPTATREDLWQLYALSRVNEILLLRFQSGEADGSKWLGPSISLDQYIAFMEALGLSTIKETSYSSFYHEIVRVDQVEDKKEPVFLIRTFWPGMMLGSMLFSRAGVHVSAGCDRISKEVAETSTLYWAYRRKNRPVEDLSQGWGGNSQWRTDFRRDYRIGDQLYFNVDGTEDLADPAIELRDDLTQEEWVELVVHRCLIITKKRHDDLWPYSYAHHARFDL